MPNIKIKRITKNNFDRYSDLILESEQSHPKKIRSDYGDYKDILKTKDSLGLMVFEKDEYVGNIIGCPYRRWEVEEDKIKNIERGKRVFYIYNLVIEPEYRGKGYGYVLVEKFIERIKRRKYNYIVAHVKVGKSLSLFKKFNATIEKEFKNYEKTGKRYDLIVIDLKKKYFDADPKLLVKRKL